MCVCVRAPARCSGNDGTQCHFAVPRKRVFEQLDRNGMLHEFSQSILYSGEPLKCIKKQFVFYSQVCFDTLIKKK